MIETITQPNLQNPFSHSCGRVWHQQSTVDISLLLKPNDEDEPQQVASPLSNTRSDSVPASIAHTPLSVARIPAVGRTLTSAPPNIPAKRPAPANSHSTPSSEPPAKKQSKWSPDEDARIIQLRGDGMKWEDISKHLPGRSAISCRLHYQNYLERRSEWDEDRKNKLARLYERFKADMWAKIADEMAIPWRAAEAMHWQMGENEMARRAGVTPFVLNNTNPPPSHAIGPRHSSRHSATATRMSRESFSRPATGQQLPSLAELTAGLPAYAPHTTGYLFHDRTPGTPYQHHPPPPPHQTLTPPPGNLPQTEYFAKRT